MEARQCWLCHRNGVDDSLERHHIFGAANRNKSDRYGLTVLLCGERCHRNGPYAVHRNHETMQKLHEYGQTMAMIENDWTIDDFRREFGKNYLDEAPEREPQVSDFKVLDMEIRTF